MQFGSPAGGGNPPPRSVLRGAATGTTSFCAAGCPCIMGIQARDGMKKKDSTEVMRVRQSAGRNKVSLIICAVAAIIGVVGWLSTL